MAAELPEPIREGVYVVGRRAPPGWRLGRCCFSGERVADSAGAAVDALIAAARQHVDGRWAGAHDGVLAISDLKTWAQGEEHGASGDVHEMVLTANDPKPIPLAEQAAARERPSLVELRARLQAALAKAECGELRQADRNQLVLVLADVCERLLGDRLEFSDPS